MADKLLFIANRTGGTSQAYVSSFSAPAYTQVHDEAWTAQRCHIHPTNENLMAIAGIASAVNAVRYSSNGGAAWSSSVFASPGNSRVRCLVITGGTRMVCLSERYALSTNGGANFTEPALALAGSQYVDAVFLSELVGWMLKTDEGAGTVKSYLFSTVDGGATWTQQMDLTALTGWVATESARRLRLDGTGQLLLLTSHSLYRITISGYTGALVWAYDSLNAFLFTLYGATGRSGVSDLNTRFDEIQYDNASGHIWLGGVGGLRARSMDDGVTWQFGAVGEFDSVAANNRLHIIMGNGTYGYFAYAKTSPAPLPQMAGLYRTSNAAANLSFVPVGLPADRNLVHIWGLYSPPDQGCTDPDACNYDSAATLDDGSCQHAVLLTDCVSGSVLHSSSTSLTTLACRPPRWGFNLNSLIATADTVLMQFAVNGSPAFSFGLAVSTSLTASERVEFFLQSLIHYINTNTLYTANFIPPALNTFNPGGLGGVWITAPDNTVANQFASISQFGFLDYDVDETFDAGSAGSVVQLAEFPGNCYRVCGGGDCSLASDYTVVAAFPNCTTCLPPTVPIICRDCDMMVRVDDQWLLSSPTNRNVQCAVAGQTITLDVLFGFPPRTPVTLTPVETGDACAGNCPMTLTYAGDQTSLLPVGSEFTVNPSSEVYTVASSEYDNVSDVTTVVTVENCQSNTAIDDVTTFTNCNCELHVLVENESAGTTLFDQTYPCVNQVAQLFYQLVIPEYGTYKITITGTDCGDTRTCTYWIDVCEEYRMINTGCHTWNVVLERPAGAPQSPDNVSTIVITDLSDGTVLFSGTRTDSQFPLSVIGEHDTVYGITITTSHGTTWASEYIDLCDIRACRMKLAKEVFCGDEDPCDSDCRNDQTNAQRRIEISRIALLLQELHDALELYRYRWLGVPTYNEERNVDRSLITTLVTSIRTISTRCGVCEDTNTTSPCLDC